MILSHLPLALVSGIQNTGLLNCTSQQVPPSYSRTSHAASGSKVIVFLMRWWPQVAVHRLPVAGLVLVVVLSFRWYPLTRQPNIPMCTKIANEVDWCWFRDGRCVCFIGIRCDLQISPGCSRVTCFRNFIKGTLQPIVVGHPRPLPMALYDCDASPNTPETLRDVLAIQDTHPLVSTHPLVQRRWTSLAVRFHIVAQTPRCFQAAFLWKLQTCCTWAIPVRRPAHHTSRQKKLSSDPSFLPSRRPPEVKQNPPKIYTPVKALLAKNSNTPRLAEEGADAIGKDGPSVFSSGLKDSCASIGSSKVGDVCGGSSWRWGSGGRCSSSKPWQTRRSAQGVCGCQCSFDVFSLSTVPAPASGVMRLQLRSMPSRSFKHWKLQCGSLPTAIRY